MISVRIATCLSGPTFRDSALVTNSSALALYSQMTVLAPFPPKSRKVSANGTEAEKNQPDVKTVSELLKRWIEICHRNEHLISSPVTGSGGWDYGVLFCRALSSWPTSCTSKGGFLNNNTIHEPLVMNLTLSFSCIPRGQSTQQDHSSGGSSK